ncbi:hypothetical protein Tco_1097060 [Tanacetum coccineum]
MATMAENVIAAGKENGEMLKDSIENGPFQLKPEIIVKDTDGTTDITRPQKVEDCQLTFTISSTNIKLQRKYGIALKNLWKPGESIHSYYLRYVKLINDMNMIPMFMSPMKINTKFVNHLQLEWSRFVTAAKQARNLHSVNLDQLYAFLKHDEIDAKEVLELRQQFSDPLALLDNTYNPLPSYSNQQI